MADVSTQRPLPEPDLHAESGSDEGRWAETSAIYINNQYLCRLHKREQLWERLPRLQHCLANVIFSC